MREAMTLYLRLIGAQLRSKWQYKTSAILEIVAYFFITFVDFAGVAVLFHSFPSLQGWSLNEMAFLYGVSAVSFSTAQLFVRGFEKFDRQVRKGELDRVLIRPVSPYLQILGIDLAINRLGRLAQGMGVLVFALLGLSVEWDIAKIVLLGLTFMSGILIFVGIFTIGAVSTIWTVTANEFINIFTNGGNYLTSFPLNIYQEWFRNFFIFVVPLGFINYLPSLIILNKGRPGDPLWIGWLGLPVALLFFGLSLGLWRYGLHKYQSTGN